MRQETDEELRSEADRMLDSGLRGALESYGTVHVIGSYALRLMVWRDLDIHIVRGDLNKPLFFELGGQIASLLKPPKMHFRDETIAATEGLPRGLYWGIYLGDERAGAWKIDIWAEEPSGFERTRSYGERIAERLSGSTRSSILQIKAACWKHPQYRREFSSSDIYTAVLEHGVVDIEGFREYLMDLNRQIRF